MRTHSRYTRFMYRQRGDVLADLVRPEHLAAARLEPALDNAAAALFLDLVFRRDSTFAVVPFIRVVTAMLDERESSPLVWPHAAAEALDPAVADAVEAAVLPWVEAQTFNRALNAEAIRVYDPDARADFSTARERGFLGAAPYRIVFQMAAPYVFALAHAGGKTVRCADAQGGTGAALLCAAASRVTANLGSPQVNALAARWFSLPVFSESRDACDMTIGGNAPARTHVDLAGAIGTRIAVAAPVPMDVAVSFDLEDAPPIRSFAVTVPQPEAAAPQLPAFTAHGGSGGRIAIAVRDGWQRQPDADTDSALLLAERLRAEGFVADVWEVSQLVPERYDLVHCCCAAFPEIALPALRRARACGVPVVVTEPFAARDGDAAWGSAIVPQILRQSADDVMLDDHLRMLRERRLEAPGATRNGKPFADYDAAVAELAGLATAIVPSSAPPFLPAASAGAQSIVPRDVVLVHAPLTPRCNQFILLRAATLAGLPVLFAGTQADAEYARFLHAYATPQTFFAPEPALADAPALYAAARVFADAAWMPLGPSRRALARACGTRVAAPPEVDPADERRLAALLTEAWHAPRPAPAPDCTDPLTPVVEAYSNCVAAGRK